MRGVVPSLAVALALSLGAGCAGDRNSGRTDGAVRIDTAQKDGPAGGGDSTVDAITPDTITPDTITPDTGPQPGGPCPCSGGLICALGACRTPCTDADCNEGGPCAASEACIPVGNAAACLPAVGEGAACDLTSNFCAKGLLCLALGGLSDRCWKSCTNTPCGGGANPKCWDIQGTSCKYCGPN